MGRKKEDSDSQESSPALSDRSATPTPASDRLRADFPVRPCVRDFSCSYLPCNWFVPRDWVATCQPVARPACTARYTYWKILAAHVAWRLIPFRPSHALQVPGSPLGPPSAASPVGFNSPKAKPLNNDFLRVIAAHDAAASCDSPARLQHQVLGQGATSPPASAAMPTGTTFTTKVRRCYVHMMF